MVWLKRQDTRMYAISMGNEDKSLPFGSTRSVKESWEQESTWANIFMGFLCAHQKLINIRGLPGVLKNVGNGKVPG